MRPPELSAGKSHVHKIPRFRGGGILGLGGGESADFIHGREEPLKFIGVAQICHWQIAHQIMRKLSGIPLSYMSRGRVREDCRKFKSRSISEQSYASHTPFAMPAFSTFLP